jgi:hypothetical protein
MSANIHDDNPLPSICWERWNRLGMTWQEAVEEASTIFHLAVQLDECRALHKIKLKIKLDEMHTYLRARHAAAEGER